MKKRMKRGSMTIEAALLMPLLLLVVTITLYLFFYVHNKVWLTAAAYEAALDGSLETARPEGKSRDKALKKGKEIGVCGEMAGEPVGIVILLSFGIKRKRTWKHWIL